MIRRPPRSTLPYTLLPDTTRVRSSHRLSVLVRRSARAISCGVMAQQKLVVPQLKARHAVHADPRDRVTTAFAFDCDAAGLGPAHLWNTNDRSEEHTSELQSLMRISYAVFCLKKKTIKHPNPN